MVNARGGAKTAIKTTELDVSGEGTVSACADKALKMLEKGADPEEVLERLARDLTNKLIHAPTAGLRQLAKEGGKRDVSKMAAMLGLTDFDDERDEGATLQ